MTNFEALADALQQANRESYTLPDHPSNFVDTAELLADRHILAVDNLTDDQLARLADIGDALIASKAVPALRDALRAFAQDRMP